AAADRMPARRRLYGHAVPGGRGRRRPLPELSRHISTGGMLVAVTALTPFAGDDPAQRASDADRDRIAAILGEALATGRLTSAEHADRLDAAYSAVTLGDLAPLVKDLPEVAHSPSTPAFST